MDNVIAAEFVDIKTVRTRRACQLVFEIPIEQMADALDTLGVPRPDVTVNVAIAPLIHGAVERKPERLPGGDKAVQQCAFLCKEASFQAFLGGSSEENTRELVLSHLEIDSRAKLATDASALRAWNDLVLQFRREDGMGT